MVHLKRLQSYRKYIHWIALIVMGMTLLPIYVFYPFGIMVFGFREVLPWWATIIIWTVLLLGYLGIRLRKKYSHSLLITCTLHVVALTGILILLYVAMPSILLYYIFYLSGFFFTSATRYLLISLFLLGISLLGLVFTPPNRFARFCCLGCMIVVMTFPVVVSYQPALTTVPGYHVQFVTKPGRIHGVIKEIRRLHEGQECHYRLLGWDQNTALYYQSTCGTRVQYWRYDPSLTEPPLLMTERPRQLNHLTPSDTKYKGIFQWIGHNVCIVDKNIAPNEQWAAVVVTHTYGPDDVLVFSDRDEELMSGRIAPQEEEI